MFRIKNKVLNNSGLFAKFNIKRNSRFYKLSGEIVDKPTRTSIEIGENEHIEDEYGIYINHSFNPTVRIEGDNIVSINDINKGDEITFNYNETETTMMCPFLDDSTQQFVSGKINKSQV